MVVPLSQIESGETAQVVFLAGSSDTALRLFDLGFAPVEAVSCVIKGKKGGMSAYLVRCAVIALRQKNAQDIFVSRPDSIRPDNR